MIGFLKNIASKVIVFVLEVKAEMIKVAWPSRQEIVASTWVVIIGVFFVAIWIFISDNIAGFTIGRLSDFIQSLKT